MLALLTLHSSSLGCRDYRKLPRPPSSLFSERRCGFQLRQEAHVFCICLQDQDTLASESRRPESAGWPTFEAAVVAARATSITVAASCSRSVSNTCRVVDNPSAAAK